MNKRKWITTGTIILIIVLASVLTTACQSEDEVQLSTSSSTLASAATPTQAASPVPTSTQPQPVYAQPGVLTTEAFIENALAGQYKIGETIKVSAIIDGWHISYKGYYYFRFVGQKTDYYIFLIVYPNAFQSLKALDGLFKEPGQTLILEGEYEGWEEDINFKSGHNGFCLKIISFQS